MEALTALPAKRKPLERAQTGPCGRPRIEEDKMITSGTVLMAGDAPRPPCVQVDNQAFPSAWVSVTHSLPHELEKCLLASGWTFFYMAGAFRTTAFGFDRTKMIHSALRRAIISVSQQKCNSLEIDAVTSHSFLGIPYVSVSGHPRHIQKGAVFSGR